MKSSWLAKAFAYWNTPPRGLEKSYHRSFLAYSYGFPVSLVAHVFFLVVFGICGVSPLFFCNWISVAIWITAIYLVRRGMIYVAVTIGVAEFIVHLVLAVVLLGLGPQFQLFLLFPPMIFLAPPGKLVLKGFLTIASTVALLFCYYYAAGHAPLVALKDPFPNVLSTVNVLFAIAAFTIFAQYFNGAVVRADAVADREYSRSESLLHSILPASVAEELKTHGASRPVRIRSPGQGRIAPRI